MLGALTFLPCPSVSRLRLRGQLGREAEQQHKPKPWAVRDPPPGTQESEPSPEDAQPTRATGRRSSRCLDSQAAERLDSGEALGTDRPRPGPAPCPAPASGPRLPPGSGSLRPQLPGRLSAPRLRSRRPSPSRWWRRRPEQARPQPPRCRALQRWREFR